MSFGIQLACSRLDELGDPLSGLKPLIDWEAFRPIVEEIYDNRTEKGGHPNYDEVLMIKILVLQQYGMVYPIKRWSWKWPRTSRS